MVIIGSDKKFVEVRMANEAEFENDVVRLSKSLFGKDTIYVDAKKKLTTKSLGNVVPDGFLFDFRDPDNPEFYIVEVELAAHDFYGHIFPQVTKFFAFFKNLQSQSQLVEKLHAVFDEDADLKRELKKHLKNEEVFKFIKDLIADSQNILIVIDGEKDEIPEIMDTYADTWGKIVRLMIVQKFRSGQDLIFSVEPEFENIDYSLVTSADSRPAANQVQYTEEFHLDGVDPAVKEAYLLLKDALGKFDPTLVFNPKKYYVSLVHGKNVAFFQFSKKKLRITVVMEVAAVEKKILHHKVRHLTESVQKFWNGPSCEVIIEGKENIAEVESLLKELVGGTGVGEKERSSDSK